jgi:Zincin-like metallopeptidase
VFNAEQCDGLPTHYYARAEPPALTPMQRLEAADRFFAATGADIRHWGTQAYYALGPDYIQMPPFETFRDADLARAPFRKEAIRRLFGGFFRFLIDNSLGNFAQGGVGCFFFVECFFEQRHGLLQAQLARPGLKGAVA